MPDKITMIKNAFIKFANIIKATLLAIGKTMFALRHIFSGKFKMVVDEIGKIFPVDDEGLGYLGYRLVGSILGVILFVISLWELSKKIIRAIIKYYKKEKQNT